MLVEAFKYFIHMLSTCITWVFNLQLIENPSITFGQFLLGFAILGLVILLIFKPLLDRRDN